MGTLRNKHTLSQCNKIVDYMNCHGSITQAEAASSIGCYRLAARIFDLKEKGYSINKIMCVKKNDEGNTVQFAKYSIIKEEDNGKH